MPGINPWSFNYQNVLWVSSNGSDSNTGLNINSPFLTGQHAVTVAGNTPTVIYFVNFPNGGMGTITTAGTGQFLQLVADNQNFDSTITCASGDEIFVLAQTARNITNNGGVVFADLNPNALIFFNQTAGTSFLNTPYIDGSANISGGTCWIDNGIVTAASQTINLTGGCSLFIYAPGGCTITNDGTCTVNGILNGMAPGPIGPQFFNSGSGSLSIGTARTTGNFYTLPATDGAANQVMKTNGSGIVSWQNTSGFTPHAYINTFWVSQLNGSNANLGTSIETPFQTVQHAITAASTNPTIIYVVDDNTANAETLTTLGSQNLTIIAPGTSFVGSFTDNGDQINFKAASLTTLNNNSNGCFYECNFFDTIVTAGDSTFIGLIGNFTAQNSSVPAVFGSVQNILTLGTNAICFFDFGVSQTFTGNPNTITDTGAFVNGRVGNIYYGAVQDSAGGFRVGTKDVTANFTSLGTGSGKVNAIVAALTELNNAQYKISNIYINAGGTNFSGGDRDLQLTDGTTVYTVIPSASLLTLANAGWGSVAVPFPAAAGISTLTQANATVYWQYVNGTTAYTAGSVVLTVEYARVV